jgi:hypothetical protein
MAGVDDHLVRNYFEMHGFFVRQSRKPVVSARRKRPTEDGDLLVINPTPRAGGELPFQLFSSDLPGLSSAMIAVRVGHTSKALTPGMIKKGELLEFIRKEAVEAAREAFTDLTVNATTPLAKIIILPGLPTQEPQRSESIQLLRASGVDHVLTFRTILENLVQAVESHPGENPSELLQFLRLLRIYDMVKSGQMELFGNTPFEK